MDSINTIDQQIAALKARREQLKVKTALKLYRELEELMGERFNMETVLGMVSDVLPAASDEDIQGWRQKGQTFFRPPSRKPQKKRSKNPEAGSTKKTLSPTHEDGHY